MRDEELVDLAERLGWETTGGWMELPLHRRADGTEGSTERVAWLLTGDGMLAVITAMEAKGFYPDLEYFDLVRCRFRPKDASEAVAARLTTPFELSEERALPEAVARAALAALTGREGHGDA